MKRITEGTRWKRCTGQGVGGGEHRASVPCPDLPPLSTPKCLPAQKRSEPRGSSCSRGFFKIKVSLRNTQTWLVNSLAIGISDHLTKQGFVMLLINCILSCYKVFFYWLLVFICSIYSSVVNDTHLKLYPPLLPENELVTWFSSSLYYCCYSFSLSKCRWFSKFSSWSLSLNSHSFNDGLFADDWLLNGSDSYSSESKVPISPAQQPLMNVSQVSQTQQNLNFLPLPLTPYFFPSFLNQPCFSSCGH